MVAGTLTVLICLSMAVLIQTGWFPFLEEEWGTKKEWLALGLFLEALFLRVLIPPAGPVQVHVGILMLLPLLNRWWKRRKENGLMLTSSAFFAGAILFLLRELYWIEPVAQWGGPRGGGLLITLAVALLSSSSLSDRLMVTVGGMWAGEGMFLSFHRRELNPVSFGEADFLDFLWSAMVLTLLLHVGFKHALHWVRNVKGLT
ncbi:hypothetical protein C8P63_11030 [Melghirimyces profundicolus]|uniref:Uncharacterized protein n=1 Tax=Melghirimyces profundicolus TaxID=1242148 RepID=A0A2T6BV18_9BACL|nr:hypothetical protein [Melghirimyces profundicolus]PTX59886.1 hypothetical protein C8P63_11030 [Melghirimyces profundicolus]